VLAQISTASTNTDKADAPLPDKVVTKKNTRRTTEAVTTPRSTNEILRARRQRPRACALSSSTINTVISPGSQTRGTTVTYSESAM
jgi:hypothetical protein